MSTILAEGSSNSNIQLKKPTQQIQVKQIKFNMTRSFRGNFKTAKSTPTKMETTKRTTTETTPSIIITPLPTNSAIAAKKTFSKNNRKT